MKDNIFWTETVIGAIESLALRLNKITRNIISCQGRAKMFGEVVKKQSWSGMVTFGFGFTCVVREKVHLKARNTEVQHARAQSSST